MPIISNFPTKGNSALLWKQDKLTGDKGQLVGFDEYGNAVAQDVEGIGGSSSDLVTIPGGAELTFEGDFGEAPYKITITEDGMSVGGVTAGVGSFNGRTGDVVPENGDYTAEQVGAVPTSRKVNGKALSSDITISAEDVNSIPNTRKINGKVLNDDINISAEDVGAAPSAAAMPSGGTTGQILTKKSQTDYDTEWKDFDASGIEQSLSNIVSVDGGAEMTLDGTYGEKPYAIRFTKEKVTPIVAGVTSFNGRNGNVLPQTGDYTAEQVGALPITGGTINGPFSVKSAGYSTDINTNQLNIVTSTKGWGGFTWNDEHIVTREYLDSVVGYKAYVYHGVGVGKNLCFAGGTYQPSYGATAEALIGAEIFNDYSERSYSPGGTVIEQGNVATALYSHAEGRGTTATGQGSHAECWCTWAKGDYSHAEGYSSVASGDASHAEGHGDAIGDSSHAEGAGVARGNYSHAANSATALATDQTAIGAYNVESSAESDRFIVGNGVYPGGGPSHIVRSNCFRATDTGVYASGNYNASGADYAEMFEWADGNPNHEDRAGRFVTLDGAKIRLAGPEDDYIIGVVSGNPSVVGDVHDDQWQGMYLYDIFGRPLWEDVNVPEQSIKNGRITIPAHVKHRQKLNPAYDNSQEYQPRSKRPEWDAVGLLGKLVAVDDGSCEINGWCTVGENGIAVKAESRTKYRVMDRLDDNHVRILIL